MILSGIKNAMCFRSRVLSKSGDLLIQQSGCSSGASPTQNAYGGGNRIPYPQFNRDLPTSRFCPNTKNSQAPTLTDRFCSLSSVHRKEDAPSRSWIHVEKSHYFGLMPHCGRQFTSHSRGRLHPEDAKGAKTLDIPRSGIKFFPS